MRRSVDGGNLGQNAAVVKAFLGNEPDLEFEDMPRVFADARPHSPYAGNVYVGWIGATRSIDHVFARPPTEERFHFADTSAPRGLPRTTMAAWWVCGNCRS